MHKLNVQEFLKAQGIILDVRSPKEFEHARIPGAINLPLFTDDERAVVGTLYKQLGHDTAVLKGFEIVGPKLKNFIVQAKEILKDKPAKVYCARGGMRSSSVALVLETAGLNPLLLNNGYKAFRHFALTLDFESANLIVIGGFSGSSKTDILHALKTLGAQVLDLEGLASHRGSSFGMLQGVNQPSIEQFENEIAHAWFNFDKSKSIYIEDESRMIGACRINSELFAKMSSSTHLFIDKPFENRVEKLLKSYGSQKKIELIDATKRISKHLGSSLAKEVIQLIEQGFLKSAIEIVLKYYDSTYLYGMEKKTAAVKKIGLDLRNLRDDEIDLKFAKHLLELS